MSTALTTTTTPQALAVFADSPPLRDITNPDVAMAAFAELATACRVHLPANNTPDEQIKEILFVLADAFPTFRLSEIAPAFRAYSAGKTNIPEEDMKTYGQPLRPAQVRRVLEAYQSAHFAKTQALQATTAPTPEQEARESELRYAAGVLQKWDYLKDRGRALDGAWYDLSAYDAWIVTKNRPGWFTPEAKAAAKEAVATLDPVEVARLHELSAPSRFLQNAGIERGVKTTAVWEHECEVCGGWQNAAYLKLLLWELVKPAAVMQEGGAQ